MKALVAFSGDFLCMREQWIPGSIFLPPSESLGYEAKSTPPPELVGRIYDYVY